MGVKVAVITEVPAATTCAVLPLIVMTPVVAEEYANVPAREPVTTGAERAKSCARAGLERFAQVEKVGKNFAIML